MHGGHRLLGATRTPAMAGGGGCWCRECGPWSPFPSRGRQPKIPAQEAPWRGVCGGPRLSAVAALLRGGAAEPGVAGASQSGAGHLLRCGSHHNFLNLEVWGFFCCTFPMHVSCEIAAGPWGVGAERGLVLAQQSRMGEQRGNGGQGPPSAPPGRGTASPAEVLPRGVGWGGSGLLPFGGLEELGEDAESQRRGAAQRGTGAPGLGLSWDPALVSPQVKLGAAPLLASAWGACLHLSPSFPFLRWLLTLCAPQLQLWM